MEKKKQIEELYIDGIYNDEPPNVFADRILALFAVVQVCEKGYVKDKCERYLNHINGCNFCKIPKANGS